jgi:metallo-beta-lactamase family protein
MCSGGKIVNYLNMLIGDRRTDILFVGYQASGTPGRDIRRYGLCNGYVQLEGRKYDINAGVYTISGYSARADCNNLVRFIRGMRKKPAEIFLIHSDESARKV